jgi:SAM-dependent methyltransferase
MSAARSSTDSALAALTEEVIWHDVENGGYGADLRLWESLARRHSGGVVDLGAGTGRVALHLAASGHQVTAVDDDPALLEVLESRAADRGLAIETVCCDVRSLALPDTHPLILAPMQLLHILGGDDGRRRALSAIAGCLSPGGRFHAAVLAEPLPLGTARPEPIPDVREVDGSIYSSLPTEIRIDATSIRMRRLRQIVGPAGELSERPTSITMDRFTLAQLDREAIAAGMQIGITSGERIPSTERYEDSVVATMGRTDA